MAITTAVTDLFASIYELAASVVGAVYTVVHSFVMGIAHLFAGFIGFFADIFKGVFDLVGGVGKFVTGNFIILAIIAAGAFAYLRFTEQGRLQANGAANKKPIMAGSGKKSN